MGEQVALGRPRSARRTIHASLQRDFMRIYVVTLLLTTMSSVASGVLTGGIDTTFVAVTLLQLVAALLVGWFPLTGVAVLAVSLVVATITHEPSSALISVPLAGLMLSWRRPRHGFVLVPVVLLAVAETFLTSRPAEAIVVVLSLLLLLFLAMLAGRGLRAAFAAIDTADHAIATSQQAPHEIRRDEREALATELVDLLERQLTASTHPPSAAETSIAASRLALATAVDRARSSLGNLHALLSTLRATERAGQGHPTAQTLQEAMELAEDQLVGHGFDVELPLETAPEVAAAHAAILGSFFRKAAGNVTRHAVPGSTVFFSHSVTKESIVATVVNARTDDTPRSPDAGLRSLRERLDLVGGSLAARPDGDRWILQATLPRAPHDLSHTQERPHQITHESPLTWMARHVPRVITIALVVWIILQLGMLLTAPMPVEATRMLHGTLGLASVAIILIGLHQPMLAAALGIAFGAVLLLLRPPLSVDAWLIAAAILYALIRLRRRPRTAALVGVALYAAVRVISQPTPLVELLGLLLLTIPVAAIALKVIVISTVSVARQRELQAIAQEQHRIRQAERRSLAGELHDVLAHHLSLIVLEAEQHLESTDHAVLQRALDDVVARNHAALVDLSMLAFILRDDTTSNAPPAPISASQTVNGLRTAIAGQGFPHDIDVDPAVDTLQQPLQRTVTRILREAVTNALRYAREGTPISLLVEVDDDLSSRVRVTSTLDPGRHEDRSGLSTGSGLNGLADRVALMGGTFTYGPAQDLWIVEAELPSTIDDQALASRKFTAGA